MSCAERSYRRGPPSDDDHARGRGIRHRLQGAQKDQHARRQERLARQRLVDACRGFTPHLVTGVWVGFASAPITEWFCGRGAVPWWARLRNRPRRAISRRSRRPGIDDRRRLPTSGSCRMAPANRVMTEYFVANLPRKLRGTVLRRSGQLATGIRRVFFGSNTGTATPPSRHTGCEVLLLRSSQAPSDREANAGESRKRSAASGDACSGEGDKTTERQTLNRGSRD